VIGWPHRLYSLWAALLIAVLLMRLLAAAKHQNPIGDDSLAGAAGARDNAESGHPPGTTNRTSHATVS